MICYNKMFRFLKNEERRMIMKKNYQNPVLEIEIFDAQDILTSSDNWVGWDTEEI